MTQPSIRSFLSHWFHSVLVLACLPAILVFSGCGGGGPANMGSTNPSPTVKITASPTSISSGESATLTVSATNATQVTISGSNGSSYTLQADGGTVSVSPKKTTTYTATATGSGGTTTATATVTMTSTPTPPPTVTITANPSSINPGGSALLHVAATNATGVTVTGSDGSSYTLAATGGSQSVSPSVTTTYTATATGPGGKVSATASVAVGAATAPTVLILANPTSVASGETSTLTVTATSATQVTVAGSDGSTYTMGPDGGTQVVKPAVTTTYTATAVGTGGTITATTTVTVVPPVMPTVHISANPSTIADGSSSTLTVTATNATSVKVTGSDGSSYTLQPSGGTPSVTPTATTTYTATAVGPGGTATGTVVVTVTSNPVPTVSINVNPTSVSAGNSSILTVAAQNATTVIVTGTDGSSYTLSASGGTQAVSPTKTTTYTATATGAGGKATATATLTITANPPPTVTISASPTSVVSGGASVLTVTSTNATTVTITGTDGSSYIVTSGDGTQSVNPTATTTYTATANGPGGTVTATATVTVTTNPTPTVSIDANPTTITSGNSSTLTVTATNATTVTVTGSDGTSYTLAATGGTQIVSPTTTTTYTATATGTAGKATDATTVTVGAAGSGIDEINHIIFMLQENHTFDDYFGELNAYRVANDWTKSEDGNTYTVDGFNTMMNAPANVNDQGTTIPLFKFKTTCIDDDASAWNSSAGDVSKYNYAATRPILMNGFAHTAEGYDESCAASGNCSGDFTDSAGKRAMGYYDQDYLNYYYYMAAQFAVSDRWFSPVASESVPNRIATFTGGTTQGLVRPPGEDKLPQLAINNIFEELDNAGVSWKIYYTDTEGFCLDYDDCGTTGDDRYPATQFLDLTYSSRYFGGKKAAGNCTAPMEPSSVIGDTTNSFCIDPNKIAPIGDPTYGYYADLKNGTLPSFAFIEPGYGQNDEHPGSKQSILHGQAEVASVINALMASSAWKDSVFFFSYDEGGGPYDHVPPVAGHSNDYTNTSALGATPPDISSIAVNPDLNSSGVAIYQPCVPATPGTPTTHCDLPAGYPGTTSTDAAANPQGLPTGRGFAAQLGFRLPNFVVSPFTREHYVSHIPMDHTAVIKFVEDRFIGPDAHLTRRDEAQPNLADPVNGFFDFTNPPWMTPPTPPTPVAPNAANCTPANM